MVKNIIIVLYRYNKWIWLITIPSLVYSIISLSSGDQVSSDKLGWVSWQQVVRFKPSTNINVLLCHNCRPGDSATIHSKYNIGPLHSPATEPHQGEILWSNHSQVLNCHGEMDFLKIPTLKTFAPRNTREEVGHKLVLLWMAISREYSFCFRCVIMFKLTFSR